MIKNTTSSERITLSWEGANINGYKMGNGNQLLIAFHGYEDKADMFFPLAKKWQDTYTSYLIDLPLHGQSEAVERLDGTVVTAFIQEILGREKANTFTLLGFSFGGRVALHILSRLHTQIEKVYLIGPDGTASFGLYHFLQKLPDWSKYTLWKGIVHPRTERLLRHLHRNKLAPKFMHRFTERNFIEATARQRLLLYWKAVKYFDIEWHKLKNIAVETLVFLGKQDEVVSPKVAKKRFNKEMPQAQLIDLDTPSHWRLWRAFLRFHNLEEKKR